MNLDVTFPNAPCYMIDLDIASSISTSWEDTPKQDLIRNRIDRDGIPISVDEPDLNDPNQAV
jgi:hypothetical protein